MYRDEDRKLCMTCKKPVPKAKRGPQRKTCSDACRQAQYRQRKGQFSWKHQHRIQGILKRRALPFVERRFDTKYREPVRDIGHRRYVYECVACGKTYIVERIWSGAPINPFCSDACRKKTDYHWEKFEEALAKSHLYRTPIDGRVWERLGYQKLSPLCPQCKKPFPPNSTLNGARLRGRPRKYCSAHCRKAAYEARWKKRRGHARGHRYRDCPECGTRFDRTDKRGRQQKRFCSRQCAMRFAERVQRVRDKARQGQHVFVYGVSGHRAAARKARVQREQREKLASQAKNAKDAASVETRNNRALRSGDGERVDDQGGLEIQTDGKVITCNTSANLVSGGEGIGCALEVVEHKFDDINTPIREKDSTDREMGGLRRKSGYL